MRIKSSAANGSFNVLDRGFEVLQVKYKSVFSCKATAEYQGNIIEIKPKSIISSKYEIYKNGIEVGDITSKWNGSMTIRIIDADYYERNFILKAKGCSGTNFKLLDENKDTVLTMDSGFSWKTMNYDFEIDWAHIDFDVAELLIYCGYAAKSYFTKMAVV
ncbi:MAG: hypothetical protein CMO01_32640 [Thalassobius sp.]|nr:hypothetical protein [Thalassovita sp.]